MPFKRKTLSELRTENQQFMQAELEKVVISSGFSPNIRGETLGINDFAQISDCIRALNGR